MPFGRWRDDEHEDLFDKYHESGLSRVIRFVREGGPVKRTIFGICCAALLLVGAYLAGFFSSIVDPNLSITEKIDQNFFQYAIRGVTTKTGFMLLVALIAVAILMTLLLAKHNGELDVIKERDVRGVNFSESGTYGTAEWLSKKEAKQEYEIGHIDNVRGTILGQYTKNGKECICLPEDTKGNRNLLILGSPGTGKSFCYVRNALYQAIVRGESAVITDTKGDLYESTSDLFRKKGYIVKVFNLVNPKRSDAWSCLSEIYDPETGDISDIRVTEFADALMKNSTDGPDDHFWGSGELNLLKAIITFCGWRRETDLKALYENEGRRLITKLGSSISEEDKEKLLNILSSSKQYTCMHDREAAIKMLIELVEGKDAVAERMKEIQLKATPCNMATIYHMITKNDISAIREKFKVVPVNHPAGIAWSIFENSADNVRPGFISGLSQRLHLYIMEDIRRITINEDIEFKSLGEQKTALYCIISDKSTAMKTITSLFFTFLFKDIADAADLYGPETRLPVNVICDEFANLGVIPNFDVVISTVRSRKINISIILQSVMQLNKNYKENAETIISCCDTILFLGCNDIETANFISELSGVASIRVLSTKDNRGSSLGYRGVFQGYQIGEGDGKRNLLNPDEVRRIPREDVIIYHNGRNILQAHRCGYIEHKFYRESGGNIVRLRDYQLTSEKYPNTPEIDAFVQGDISNMRMQNATLLSNEAAQNMYSTGRKDSDDKSEKSNSDKTGNHPPHLNYINNDENFDF